MIYEFEKDSNSGVIFVSLKLENKYTLKMVLDTAASHTTIDTTALYMAGYSVGQATKTSEVETANGIIKVSVFEVESLTALGHTVHHISVQAYDFLAHGILSDYDGLLGLDFFENTILCIDMKNHTIELIIDK